MNSTHCTELWTVSACTSLNNNTIKWYSLYKITDKIIIGKVDPLHAMEAHGGEEV
jgi:hypothetical protein